jgi:hypothetical protein
MQLFYEFYKSKLMDLDASDSGVILVYVRTGVMYARTGVIED